jgi:hypothetical protein
VHFGHLRWLPHPARGECAGLCRDKKLNQFGPVAYDALFKWAHSIVKRSDAIRVLMSCCETAGQYQRFVVSQIK